jgi:predicted Rossmann fold nucleotide-binding protein DprA/Smf involved in DNA uptake
MIDRAADRRLAIVGSRALAGHKWNEPIIRGWLRHRLAQDPEGDPYPIVISGGAAGIDQEAEAIARTWPLPFLPILPRASGADACLARDQWIAWLCTDLLCIEAGWSATKGAGLTAQIARAMGRNVTHLIIRSETHPHGAGVTHVIGATLEELQLRLETRQGGGA